MTSPPTFSDHSNRLPYMPGLDGLRALAVMGVLLYHAGLPVPGGFLGVESFFVLSGFLITCLLLAEWREHRRIDLRAFWLRRARRLLPALLFTLSGTVLLAALMLRGERNELGADVLAALSYVMNWHLIARGQSYFDPLLRPSLLQHLWSLAVEEQFYLLWPLIFVAGMRVLRRRGLVLVVVAASGGSLALMTALYGPGSDPSRIYYGTDTRASGVLIGAALALMCTPTRTPATATRRVPRLLDGMGVVALGGLLACFVAVSERHSLLYRGGFALVDVLTVLLILAAIHPGTRLIPTLLGWQPLRALGLRSYGIYLWHWPIFMVTRPHLDLPLSGLPLLGLRLLIVATLVEVSYRWIELPVRGGGIGRAWPRLWTVAGKAFVAWRPRPAMPSVVRWLTLLMPVLLFLAVGATALSNEPLPLLVSQLEVPSPPVPPLPTPAMGAATSMGPADDLTALQSAERPGQAGPALTATDPAPFRPSSAPMPGKPQPLDPVLVAQLQALLDDTVADGHIPGVVLAVRIPGYEAWSGASGVADRAPRRPMQPDTLLHLSSVTKMFTAVVVLQLVEEGTVNLDAPIGTYLPDLVPLADQITVRQLLNHTSGIFDYLEDEQFFIGAYKQPQRTYTPRAVVGMVDQYGAAFEPGLPGAWKYSSTNYVILGMLVEQVTGRTMAEEVRTRISEPLNLQHTFFAPYEPVQGVVAEGYIDASDRADVSMTFVFATGNMIATADDLRQFVDAVFAGRLLSVESLALMTEVIDTGGAYAMPELHYGLGLMRARLNVAARPDGMERPETLGTVFGHIGGIAGSRSAVWHVPASGITIALGMNQANIDPNLLARDTLEVILAWQGQ